MIVNLSLKDYVQFIRIPIKYQYLDIISEGVSVIDADLLHNIGFYGNETKIAVIDGGFGGMIPSTIIDCSGESPMVIREGLGEVDY